MINDKICGIYKIENLVNSKIYVGSSINIYSRWYDHKITLKKNVHINKHLQRAHNKYGIDNFSFEVVEKCEKEDLLIREQYWMDYYKSYSKDNGYNICSIAGSSIGRIVSDDTKLKLSLIQKNRKPIYQIDIYGNIIKEWRGIGEIQKDNSLDNRNIKQSLLHKSYKYIWNDYLWVYKKEYNNFNIENYIDEINTYLLNKNKDPLDVIIVQLSLDCKYIKEWKNIATASKELNINYNNIALCINGRCQVGSGYRWLTKKKYLKFKDSIQDCFHEVILNNRKAIVQLNLKNEYLSEFNSMEEACKLLKLKSKSSIVLCCKGNYKTAYGYKWMYKEDYQKLQNEKERLIV